MSLLTGIWRVIIGRGGCGLVETQLSLARQQVVDAFAGEQAELLWAQKITEEQALAAITLRFPEMTSSQVAHTLARGMFLTR
jgi:hypothetical protein